MPTEAIRLENNLYNRTGKPTEDGSFIEADPRSPGSRLTQEAVDSAFGT